MSTVEYYAVKFSGVLTVSTANNANYFSVAEIREDWIPAGLETYNKWLSGSEVDTNSAGSTGTVLTDVMVGRATAIHLEDAQENRMFNAVTGDPVNYNYVRFFEMMGNIEDVALLRKKLPTGKLIARRSNK